MLNCFGPSDSKDAIQEWRHKESGVTPITNQMFSPDMIQPLTPAHNRHMWTLLCVTLIALATPPSVLLNPHPSTSAVKPKQDVRHWLKYSIISARKTLNRLTACGFTAELIEWAWLMPIKLIGSPESEYLKRQCAKIRKKGTSKHSFWSILRSFLHTLVLIDWLRPTLIGYCVNVL